MSHKQGILKRSLFPLPSLVFSHPSDPFAPSISAFPPSLLPVSALSPPPRLPLTDSAFPPCPVGGPPGESAVDWCLYQLNGAAEFEVSDGEYRGAEVGRVPSTAAPSGSVWRNVACWCESGNGRTGWPSGAWCLRGGEDLVWAQGKREESWQGWPLMGCMCLAL